MKRLSPKILILIGLFVLPGCWHLGANRGTETDLRCQAWISQIDPSVPWQSIDRNILKTDEFVEAARCLLTLQGNKSPAKWSGATHLQVSQELPSATVEVAAIYFIGVLFYGRTDYCNGVALEDSRGRLNTEQSVLEAYKAYRNWIQEVDAIGLESARELGLGPLDKTSAVQWY